MSLSNDRNTPERSGHGFELGVKAATKIYGGALVCRSSTGLAVPGAVATTLKPLGRAEEQADNSGGADNDINVKYRPGIFRWNNSASTDQLTVADIGNDCYIVDDQTVAKTDGSSARSKAGVVVDVDDIGVWVATGAGVGFGI